MITWSDKVTSLTFSGWPCFPELQVSGDAHSCSWVQGLHTASWHEALCAQWGVGQGPGEPEGPWHYPRVTSLEPGNPRNPGREDVLPKPIQRRLRAGCWFG